MTDDQHDPFKVHREAISVTERSIGYVLTEQEQRLVELVAAGLSDTQVARELEVSVATMQRRLKKLAEAVGARSRVNLVVRALELQIARIFELHQGEGNPSPLHTGPLRDQEK